MAALRAVATDAYDWSAPAGGLEWSCLATAEHVAGDFTTYAAQLTGRTAAIGTYVPMDVRLEEGTGADGAVRCVAASAGLLAAVVRTTPPGVRGYHPFPYGSADATGFALEGLAPLATGKGRDRGAPRGPAPRALAPPQPRVGEPPHQFPGPDLHGPGPHGVPVPVRRQVVVVPVEAPLRHPEARGEGVQFLVRDVADEVGPHPPVAGPGGRVDVERHRATVPREPTAATTTPALPHTQCGSAPSSGSTSRACGSPEPHTGHSGHRP